MTNFKHLTKEEREKITVLHAQYYSIRQIAREMERSSATVSRELNRRKAAYLEEFYLRVQSRSSF